MPIRRLTYRFVAFALTALAVTGLPSCGGDDGGSTGAVATFTPDTPAPAAGTVAMLAGSRSGTAVNVRITLTGVDDVLGAAFRVTYDPDTLFFNGMDASASLLRAGGVGNASLFFQADESAVFGQVIVTATRLNPTTAPPVDVGATADLVVLNFSARRTIPGGDLDGLLDFDASREVTVCATPTTCTAASLTWSGGAVTSQ